MSDYNLQIAWSGKDALADSDPDKVVSGGDFNTEFLAVKTSVNSKADLANTSQVVTAATASSGFRAFRSCGRRSGWVVGLALAAFTIEQHHRIC